MHSVSHQARENQMLLGEVIGRQLHADDNRGPLSGEGHALHKNISKQDSDWLGWLISPAMARRGCPESSGACS